MWNCCDGKCGTMWSEETERRWRVIQTVGGDFSDLMANSPCCDLPHWPIRSARTRRTPRPEASHGLDHSPAHGVNGVVLNFHDVPFRRPGWRLPGSIQHQRRRRGVPRLRGRSWKGIVHMLRFACGRAGFRAIRWRCAGDRRPVRPLATALLATGHVGLDVATPFSAVHTDRAIRSGRNACEPGSRVVCESRRHGASGFGDPYPIAQTAA